MAGSAKLHRSVDSNGQCPQRAEIAITDFWGSGRQITEGDSRHHSGRRRRHIEIAQIGRHTIQSRMAKTCTTRDLVEAEYWQHLAALLPAGGVGAAWSNEQMCRDRLVEVRWPNGVTCPKCDDQNVGFLETRKTYVCRNCRYHFTVLTRTWLQSSKQTPQLWFHAAEAYTRWKATRRSRTLTIHAFSKILGVPYPSARRARMLLEADLGLGGSGLLVRCICVGA